MKEAPRCLLTFDVEDWFHAENLRGLFPPSAWDAVPRRVAASTRRILRLLADEGIRSTFFVLGWVAEREPGLVEEIAAAGHEVASHGHGHILPLRLEPEAFREDLLRARPILAAAAGTEVMGYRAPSFSLDRERLSIVADCGFRYDSSRHPFGLHDRYGRLPGLRPIRPGVYALDGTGGDRLLELELPVEAFGPLALPASGGGYFRLYPGPLFRRLVRRAISRRGHYLMYLHSWEFDPDQPRARGAGVLGTFRHYQNLRRTPARMRRLIAMLRGMGARFMTVRDFLDEVT